MIHSSQCALFAALFALMAAALVPSSHAFHYGHDKDLIENVMMLKGYPQNSRLLVSTYLWFTHYFADFADADEASEQARHLLFSGAEALTADEKLNVIANAAKERLQLEVMPSPTMSPTASPSPAPSTSPTPAPTAPTTSPTLAPVTPTTSPTKAPTTTPTTTPTKAPTMAPIVKNPTLAPSVSPTMAPTSPTAAPTMAPTASPFTPSIYVPEGWAKSTESLFSIYGYTVASILSFYSRSDYASKAGGRACTCLPAKTYFDDSITGVVVPNATARGQYCEGSNKESYASDGWINAYSHAFVATYQWISWLEAVANAVNTDYPAWVTVPGLQFDNASEPVIDQIPAESTADMKRDLLFAYKLSLWKTSDVFPNGAWKGPQSGNYLNDLVAKLAMPKKSQFYKNFLSGENLIINALSTHNGSNIDKTGTWRDDLPAPPAFKAAVLRTHSVKSLTPEARTPDLYAQTSVVDLDIGELVYVDTTYRDQQEFSPQWIVTHFFKADVGEFNMSYSIWDEVSTNRDEDKKLSINSAQKDILIRYTSAGVLTVAGIARTVGEEFTLTGLNVTVTLSVSVIDVQTSCAGDATDDTCAETKRASGEPFCTKRKERVVAVASGATSHIRSSSSSLSLFISIVALIFVSTTMFS